MDVDELCAVWNAVKQVVAVEDLRIFRGVVCQADPGVLRLFLGVLLYTCLSL